MNSDNSKSVASISGGDRTPVDDNDDVDEIFENKDADNKFVIDDVDDDDGEYDYQYPVRGRRGAKKKGFLKEDLTKMMQGFGETADPRDDTLDLMEGYVFEFINNVIHRSLARSQRAGFAQIQVRDLLKIIEQYEKKLLRAPYIITGQTIQQKFNKNSDKFGNGGMSGK
jgi:hypothetical protein